MRVAVVATAICLSIVGLAAAADAQAAIRKPTHIPAQRLDQALQSLAKERGLAMAYRSEVVGSRQTAGASGDLTRDEALTQLLSGTGLTYRFLDDVTVTIQSGEDAAKEASAASPKRLRLTQADPAMTAGSGAAAAQDVNSRSDGSILLQEVIVTAQKREERLQDVPVPVTALSADSLINTNQLRLQDYYSQVPGFSVLPLGLHSTQTLSIRGITTGPYNNPSVGITVDDVPYGASTAVGGGAPVPDIDPSDLARVEILRGPQGTLYGASSIGGLVKFVTVDPSTEGTNGQIQAGTSSVYNGAELGYSVRGSVNLPLSDTFAFRASAFTRQDPGYIDNPVLHEDGVNEAHVSGGRISGLWRPSTDFSLKFSALYQDSKADGSSDVDVQPGLGNLQQSYIPGVGGYDRQVQAYSATVNAKLGSVDLTSVTGYNVNEFTDTFDFTYALGSSTQSMFGVTGTPIREHDRTGKFTQEIRLASHIGPRIDWIVGGFYTHESSPYGETISAENSTTGQTLGNLLNLTIPITYQEYAAFADVTFQLTDALDVQIGGRESRIKESSLENEDGPFAGATPVAYPEVDTDANAFTYLVTPRYKLSQDLMIYARLASGYRPGGANVSPGTPREYAPDKTENYELGIKSDVLDHALTFDASLYYIDWKDIQLSLVTPEFFGYTGNGSRASSKGVELSTESRPLQGLTLSAWVAFSDAKLTSPFPDNSSAFGVSGNRLPDSSRFSGRISVQQSFPLASQVSGFVGGSVNYVGERIGDFTGTAERQLFPAYARTDLRAGVQYASWSTNLFVTNLTDRRGVLSGGLGDYPPFAFTFIQPRTVGLSVTHSF